jgi:excisionase family DNA binding protein
VSELNLTLPPELVEAIARRAAEIVGSKRLESERTPWLTLSEAADYLAWSKQRLYKLTAAGAIPHRKHGNRILFRSDELDLWLEDYREGPRLPRPPLATARPVRGER